jgi:protein-L-isoaspartate(D-aspartate) O-methyltransferase
MFAVCVLTRVDIRMFIPVDDEDDGWSQHVWRVDKDERGTITKKKLFGVRYVPLTDAPSSRGRG